MHNPAPYTSMESGHGIRPLRWASTAQTHPGSVRPLNEDAILERPDLGLWAVADGMGGHEAGEVASAMVIEAILNTPHSGSLEQRQRDLSESLAATNRRLRALGQQYFQGRTLGTTLVCVMFNGSRFRLLWIGDSRCYRSRDGALTQLSRDHSQVNELVDQGLLREDQTRGHPLANRITRAIGAGEHLELDFLEGELRPGDVLLLCSDGLNDTLEDADIGHFLGQGDIVDANKAMLHEALVREARDNVSSILIEIA